jgi:hypothetical protein
VHCCRRGVVAHGFVCTHIHMRVFSVCTAQAIHFLRLREIRSVIDACACRTHSERKNAQRPDRQLPVHAHVQSALEHEQHSDLLDAHTGESKELHCNLSRVQKRQEINSGISSPATPTIATCISVSFTLKFIASRLALIGCCDGDMVMVRARRSQCRLTVVGCAAQHVPVTCLNVREVELRGRGLGPWTKHLNGLITPPANWTRQDQYV